MVHKLAILLSTPVDEETKATVRRGELPRHDFLSLGEATGATIITPLHKSHAQDGEFAKALNILRIAWAAFRHRHTYDVIISDMERVGIAVAFMFKLTGVKKGHVVICHGKLGHDSDLGLVQRFGLAKYMHRLVCYGPAVADKIKKALALPDTQVVTVRHPADHRFWKPQPAPVRPLVVSAGMTRRDFPTLIEAVRGLDVELEIAAFSPWVSSEANGVHPDDLPPNVRITRRDPQALRDLYAEALCVAVPLHKSRAQSGSLVMYEAMAMGKAVLATRTEGQDALEIIREGETGLYFEPGDVAGWRQAISRLAANPEEAAAMGRRARQVVEAGMNLDTYVADMVAIIESLQPSP